MVYVVKRIAVLGFQSSGFNFFTRFFEDLHTHSALLILTYLPLECYLSSVSKANPLGLGCRNGKRT